MTQPSHDLVDALRHVAFGQVRPVDHDDRQSEHARGFEFRSGSLAAGVLGDDERDRVLSQQREIAIERKWTPRLHGCCVRQRQWLGGRVHETKQVVVLRTGRKRSEVLPADREKDALSIFGERCHGGGDIAHLTPVVAGYGRPCRALERDMQHAALGAGEDGVAAHLGREGMRGVDQVRDALALEIVDEPRDAAETTNPRRKGLQGTPSRAPGIGVHPRDVGSRDGAGELARLRRPAQQEDALHG